MVLLIGLVAAGLMVGAWSGRAQDHGPRHFPLTCFDCHFSQPPAEDPDCFNCHGSGEAPELDCFDCHGEHHPDRAPDLSGQSNCFRCHEVSSSREDAAFMRGRRPTNGVARSKTPRRMRVSSPMRSNYEATSNDQILPEIQKFFFTARPDGYQLHSWHSLPVNKNRP
ncbi:MAG: hypothetical protein D6723_02515 [Acidobacteria bacterium]|nr:MAG: hypothetical protein D6723_02515 [Acidobacteriota bacterium]